MHRQLRLLLRSVPAEAFVAVLDDPVHELLDSDLESGCPLRRRHLLKRLYIGSLNDMQMDLRGPRNLDSIATLVVFALPGTAFVTE